MPPLDDRRSARPRRTQRAPELRARLGLVAAYAMAALLAAACASTPPAPSLASPTRAATSPSGAAGSPADALRTAAPTGGSEAPTASAVGTAPTQEASLPPSGTVSGVVLDITYENPVTVASFVIRTSSGRELTFAVGELDVSGEAFPAVHLAEHQLSAQPVLVEYTTDGGTLVALRLTDDPR